MGRDGQFGAKQQQQCLDTFWEAGRQKTAPLSRYHLIYIRTFCGVTPAIHSLGCMIFDVSQAGHGGNYCAAEASSYVQVMGKAADGQFHE